MPIITKPATIDKNSPAEISLDKAALAAVSSVVADDYFSDSDNWKEVFLYYKSSTGNQREILKFNAELASPTANFLVSDKALDIFEIQKIVIVDFDAGNITIPRSELTVADFDVDMTPAAAAGIPFQLFQGFDEVSPLVDPTYLVRTTDGFSAPLSLALAKPSIASMQSGISNFDITFNMSNITNNTGYGVTAGVYFTDTPPESITLSELYNNYESSSIFIVVNSGENLNSHTLAAGYGGFVGTAVGQTKSIQIKQNGVDTVEYYVNGALAGSQLAGDQNDTKIYGYPFIYSYWSGTLISATVV